MRWFFRELRYHKPILTTTIALAVTLSTLSDVLLPYLIAQFLEEWREPNDTPDMPMLLVWSAIVVVLLSPPKAYLTRRLEYQIRSRLAERVDNAISKRSNPLTLPRAEMTSATKTFFETWSNLSITLLVHGPPLLIGIVGMIVLMTISAPFMLLIILTVGILATILVVTTGSPLLQAWSERTDKCHQEFEAFDGLLASHETNWLRTVMSDVRASATAGWIAPASKHARAVFGWHAGVNGLSNLLLIGAVAGSVILATGQDGNLGTMFLLVWFSIMMASRINNLLFVFEIFGSGLADAKVFVDELEASIYKSAPIESKVLSLTLTGVSTCYEQTAGSGASLKTVVELPNLYFTPGVTVLTGENGRGKSTALRLMTGLLGYEGSVSFETPTGPIEARDLDVRSLSVYSSQSNAPLESSTVQSIFGKATSSDISKALEWSALPNSVPLERRLNDCSGGERRLAFNAAAMHAARSSCILLLDEPTNDLSRGTIDRMIMGFEKFIGDHADVIAIVVSHESKLLERGYRVIEM
jgi:ABC-type multidrug transport system fused ATPase/permease subunit